MHISVLLDIIKLSSLEGYKNFCFPTILIWQHLISSLLNFCPVSEHLFTCLLVIWFSLLWFSCSYLLIFIGRFATILSQFVFFAANLCTSWELDGTSFIAICLQCPTQCLAYKGFQKWIWYESVLRPKTHFWEFNTYLHLHFTFTAVFEISWVLLCSLRI